MNLILIGYRGSGKTTLGQRLAGRLGLEFVDVDDEACRRFDLESIAEVFDRHGEAAWRRMEARVACDLLLDSRQVISLGGGTLTQPEARQAVEQAADAVRIYLRCDAFELFRRIKADSKFTRTRPNLKELGGSVERVRLTLAMREPIYRAVADHVIDVAAMSIEAAEQQVVGVLDGSP